MIKDTTSKSGEYRKAYERYIDEVDVPSLPAMANELGIHPETLTIYAHRHNWAQQRATTQAQKQVLVEGSRQKIAVEMDAFVTRKVQDWTTKLAEITDKNLEILATLKLKEDEDRDTRRNLKSSADIIQSTVKSIGDLVETGRSIGLVIGPTKTEGEKKGLDFSKLTTLNFILKESQKAPGMARAAEERSANEGPADSF